MPHADESVHALARSSLNHSVSAVRPCLLRADSASGLLGLSRKCNPTWRELAVVSEQGHDGLRWSDVEPHQSRIWICQLRDGLSRIRDEAIWAPTLDVRVEALGLPWRGGGEEERRSLSASCAESEPWEDGDSCSDDIRGLVAPTPFEAESPKPHQSSHCRHLKPSKHLETPSGPSADGNRHSAPPKLHRNVASHAAPNVQFRIGSFDSRAPITNALSVDLNRQLA